MMTTIDCDQVFDVLTRGPFDADSAEEAQVELHLAGCHECRQLAEALRPAVDLLHESIEADEADMLPSYRGSLPAAHGDGLAIAVAAAIASEAPPHWQAAPQPKPRRTNHDSAGRLVGAGLVGAAFCALLWLAAANDQSTRRDSMLSAPSVAGGADDAPDERGLAWLQSLHLSSACLTPVKHSTSSGAGGPLPVASHQFQCCTRCHRSDAARPTPPEAIGAAARSCSACHKLALLATPPRFLTS